MTVLCTRIPRSSFSSLTYNPEFCFLQIIFFCELNNQALLTHEKEVGCMIRRDILRYHCLSLTEFWYKVLCVLSVFFWKIFQKISQQKSHLLGKNYILFIDLTSVAIQNIVGDRSYRSNKMDMRSDSMWKNTWAYCGLLFLTKFFIKTCFNCFIIFC